MFQVVLFRVKYNYYQLLSVLSKFSKLIVLSALSEFQCHLFCQVVLLRVKSGGVPDIRGIHYRGLSGWNTIILGMEL